MPEPEEQVAGRLEVVVEASLRGFKQRLKAKIEEASKGVNAKVGVELNAEGLREKLQATVDEAAAGVKATIGVDLDAGTLKAKVEAAAEAARANVKVTTDGGAGLAAEVAAEAKAAEAAAPDVKVPLSARVAGLFRGLFAARAEAQAIADARPVEIPVETKSRGFRFRRLLRPLIYASLASMIEPLVGVIGQAIGGLTAMVGAAGPALGTLAAFPVAISTFVTSMAAGKIAVSGVGQALKAYSQAQAAAANGTKLTAAQQQKLNQTMKDLSPSARKFVKWFVGLRPEWIKTRKAIQEPLFRHLDKDLRPLAEKILPLLAKNLAPVSNTLGVLTDKTAAWMETPLFGRQFSGIMDQNNRSLRAGGSALIDVAKGFVWFDRAAAPFQADLDRLTRSVGRWFLVTARSNARNGDTARFLDKAESRLSLLWSITKNLGSGLGGIFDAAEPSGVRLLNTFDTFLGDWADWTHSLNGQNYLRNWFDRVEPGFKELGRLIDDTFKGMAKWATDPKLVGFLRQIRTQFGPALGQLLKELGQDMSGNVIGILTQLTRTLNDMEPAIQTVSDMTSALVGLWKILNNLADVSPGATHMVAQIVGGLLVARGLGKIGRGGRRLLGIGASEGGGAGLLEALGFGAAGGAAAKGAAGKGGLLRRLLGSPSATKAAAADAEKAAEATGKISKEASKLGALAKSPLLKKAGVIGTLLTLYGLYQDEKGWLYDFGDFGGKYRRSLGTKGHITQETLKQIRSQFLKGNHIADHASDLGIDLGRLTQDLAQRGTHGVYYKALVQRLSEQSSQGNGVGGTLRGYRDLFTLGAFGHSNAAAEVLQDLIDIGKQIDKDRKKAKASSFLFDGLNHRLEAANKRRAAAAKKLNRELKGLPKRVATQIKTPGLLRSVQSVKVLADQYHLTPKQVLTVLKTSGVVKSMRDVRKAQRTFHLTPKQVVTLIKTAGVRTTLGQVAALARKYKLTPKQVVTLLKATGINFSLRDVYKLQRQYKLTPAQVLTLLKARDLASGTASRLKGIYDGLPRHITTSIVTAHYDKFYEATKHAVGGLISGPGTGTSDSIPAWLSNNEFVIRAAAVRKYGVGLLHRINSMRFASGGLVQRFRGGGHVQRFDPTGDGIGKKESKQLGVWLAHGFVQGMRGTLRDQRRTFKALLRHFEHDGMDKRHRRQFRHDLLGQLGRIEGFAKRRRALAERLNKAEGKLRDLRDQRRSLKQSLLSQAKDYTSITRLAGDNMGYITPSYLIKNLRKRVGEQTKFTHLMHELRKRGLGKIAYKQLMEAGVEQGLPIAEQLMRATPRQLHRIQRLQQAMADGAKKLGRDASKVLFNAGINATRGLVKGLRQRQRELNKAARSMAHAFVDVVKNELAGKRPGGLGPKVHVTPLPRHRRAQRAVHRAAQEAAASLMHEVRRHGSHAKRLHHATRHGSRAHEEARNARQAPLVGKLQINAHNKEDAKDLLDEAMFKLRKIRQGGVHAERTA